MSRDESQPALRRGAVGVRGSRVAASVTASFRASSRQSVLDANDSRRSLAASVRGSLAGDSERWMKYAKVDSEKNPALRTQGSSFRSRVESASFKQRGPTLELRTSTRALDEHAAITAATHRLPGGDAHEQHAIGGPREPTDAVTFLIPPREIGTAFSAEREHEPQDPRLGSGRRLRAMTSIPESFGRHSLAGGVSEHGARVDRTLGGPTRTLRRRGYSEAGALLTASSLARSELTTAPSLARSESTQAPPGADSRTISRQQSEMKPLPRPSPSSLLLAGMGAHLLGSAAPTMRQWSDAGPGLDAAGRPRRRRDAWAGKRKTIDPRLPKPLWTETHPVRPQQERRQRAARTTGVFAIYPHSGASSTKDMIRPETAHLFGRDRRRSAAPRGQERQSVVKRPGGSGIHVLTAGAAPRSRPATAGVERTPAADAPGASQHGTLPLRPPSAYGAHTPGPSEGGAKTPMLPGGRFTPRRPATANVVSRDGTARKLFGGSPGKQRRRPATATTRKERGHEDGGDDGWASGDGGGVIAEAGGEDDGGAAVDVRQSAEVGAVSAESSGSDEAAAYESEVTESVATNTEDGLSGEEEDTFDDEMLPARPQTVGPGAPTRRRSRMHLHDPDASGHSAASGARAKPVPGYLRGTAARPGSAPPARWLSFQREQGSFRTTLVSASSPARPSTAGTVEVSCATCERRANPPPPEPGGVQVTEPETAANKGKRVKAKARPISARLGAIGYLDSGQPILARPDYDVAFDLPPTGLAMRASQLPAGRIGPVFKMIGGPVVTLQELTDVRGFYEHLYQSAKGPLTLPVFKRIFFRDMEGARSFVQDVGQEMRFRRLQERLVERRADEVTFADLLFYIYPDSVDQDVEAMVEAVGNPYSEEQRSRVPAEKIREIRGVFTMWDKDGDGLLSMQELRDALVHVIGEKYISSFVKSVAEYDQDRDGKLTLEEFALWWHSGSEGGVKFENSARAATDPLYVLQLYCERRAMGILGLSKLMGKM
ncbi:unnamed protein product [Pedinophyceae sp. YPF-701]|nr:unnamed protein product [Pedinophyceae sp. YPF-701]